ncbi:MAG: UDP-N-acetylglucosamine 2-epimerase (non-hydrolyzing) [Desulfobulbaceae bacterium]|nr:UDP-N-acetylglucosamine 2-epimerase (non-hydrolyzing) [Desulfobulbaceae bacterium]
MNRIKNIDIIAGARPNFMKVAPIIKAIQKKKDSGDCFFGYRLIHTGQHYDAAMSGDFFEQLQIPAPDVNLEVGSGSQAEQTASIMIRYEHVLRKKPTDLCLVVGDVNSTMACAITAKKMRIPVAHVEAGIRSGDWSMPEEINRLVTDSITDYFFTTSEVANQNLRQSGIADERIFFVGNTMIDTLLSNLDRLCPPDFWSELALESGNYFVTTLHRPVNVDGLAQFAKLLQAVGGGTRGLPVVFPVHPRTANTLRDIDALPVNLYQVAPQPYLEFNYLVKHAKAVITDSGGITEETTVLGVPCLTLRENTERPETVSVGTNELIGTDPERLKPALDRLFAGQWKKGSVPEKWDGKTGERIVAALEKIYHKGE